MDKRGGRVDSQDVRQDWLSLGRDGQAPPWTTRQCHQELLERREPQLPVLCGIISRAHRTRRVQKRKRGDSISTLSEVMTGPGDSPIATAAPSMSRSASSNSLSSPRFTPYVRSSPMTKSRSESVSSLSAFSPLRSSSIEQFPSPSNFSSPYNSPAPMSRSHSSTASGKFSPATPRSQRHHPAPPTPLHVVSRDLNKQVFDPMVVNPDDLDDRHLAQTVVVPRSSHAPSLSRDTPPATPDGSPSPYRRDSEVSHLPPPPVDYSYGSYMAPPSPPASASHPFHPSIHDLYAERGPSSWNEGPEMSSPYQQDPGLVSPGGAYVSSFAQMNLDEGGQHVPFESYAAAPQQLYYVDHGCAMH